jgi:hypothetical protein
MFLFPTYFSSILACEVVISQLYQVILPKDYFWKPETENLPI